MCVSQAPTMLLRSKDITKWAGPKLSHPEHIWHFAIGSKTTSETYLVAITPCWSGPEWVPPLMPCYPSMLITTPTAVPYYGLFTVTMLGTAYGIYDLVLVRINVTPYHNLEVDTHFQGKTRVWWVKAWYRHYLTEIQPFYYHLPTCTTERLQLVDGFITTSVYNPQWARDCSLRLPVNSDCFLVVLRVLRNYSFLEQAFENNLGDKWYVCNKAQRKWSKGM